MYIIFYRIRWFRRFVDKTRMVSSRFRRGFVVRALRALYMRVEIKPFLSDKQMGAPPDGESGSKTSWAATHTQSFHMIRAAV